MPTVTIGPNATPIPNTGEADLYGINVGATVLYYSKGQDVSVASGTPLSPGNAIQGWPAGQPLYIISSGGNGTFSYESNGSQIAIGAVATSLLPGSSVAIAGPVSVSGSNVGISGGVDVSGSTVGNKPATAIDFLGQFRINYLAAINTSGSLTVTIPSIDVRAYSSLYFTIGDSGPFNSVIPDATTWLDLVIATTDISANIYDVYTPTFLPGNGGTNNQFTGPPFGSIQVPIRSQYLNATATFYKGVATTTGTITITVWGSHEVIPLPRYESLPAFWLGTPIGNPLIVATGVAGDYNVGTKNGPAQFNVFSATGGTTGSANLQYAFAGTWVLFDGTGAIPTGGGVARPIVLPMKPIRLHAAPTAGSLICSIQQ